MDFYLNSFLEFLTSMATSISLEFFVVAGAFLEEIIAPIPSPFVMSTAAVLATVQGYTMAQLVFLVLLASLAKTASSLLVFVMADKVEDIVVGKFGKYVGVTHDQVEKLGSLLTGSRWDEVLLFLARAIPIVPTFPVSVGAGVIKYSARSFVLTTFAGLVVRNSFFLLASYYGWSQLQSVRGYVADQPWLLVVGAVAALSALFLLIKGKDELWSRYVATAKPKGKKKQKRSSRK